MKSSRWPLLSMAALLTFAPGTSVGQDKKKATNNSAAISELVVAEMTEPLCNIVENGKPLVYKKSANATKCGPPNLNSVIIGKDAPAILTLLRAPGMPRLPKHIKNCIIVYKRHAAAQLTDFPGPCSQSPVARATAAKFTQFYRSENVR